MTEPALAQESIFLYALECESAAERAAYLDRVCADKPELRAEVESLLCAHERSGDILDLPEKLAETIEEPVTERPGTVISSYKLLEQIGEGGFGVVFMAEQQQPIRRKVALKVLKPGMDTRQVTARFEAERQALALMDHPNIAKVLDAGQTSSGRPYFVMDLVKGVPITDYCDQAQLTPRERLELFLHVCQAVQHAHQKGIIHRDLKPSNVLVTLHDGAPRAKVIDFGIAKALGQQLTDKTLYTSFAQIIGTPLYMSPEQAALSNADVDTRSDIYSLGVLLYELLTGTTPFDKERFKEVGYDELRRIIREEEPPKPSTRISTMGQASTTISAQRRSDPKRLSQLFHGELDWIVMKCLEKDRNRRYETASALAADVQRYLRDEPVQACPPSVWYRWRKFARRKKTALAMAACVLFAAGVVGWAVRDREAREVEFELDRLGRIQAVNFAMAGMLDEAISLMEQWKWREARAVVDRANSLLVTAGQTQPPHQLLELRKALSMAERLEEIYRTPKRDPNASATTLKGEGTKHIPRARQDCSQEEFSWDREQDTRFAMAFQEFDMDMEALDPNVAAMRIGYLSIRRALIQALDQWSAIRSRVRGDSDPLWKKLVEIARLADPDEWRNQIRDAVLLRDRPKLEKLADALPVRGVPPATMHLLGQTLKNLGALDKAMSVLREAHRRHPEDFWINDALGWFSVEAFHPPRYNDALRYYTAALAARPQSARAHRAVADMLMRLDAIDEAIAEYSRVTELNAELAAAGYRLATPQEWDFAAGENSESIQLARENAAALHGRGRAYARLNQWHKAVADLSQALAWASDWPLLQNDLAWLLATCPEPKKRDPRRAVELAAKAVEHFPTRSDFWTTLGVAHYRAGHSKDAIDALTKSMNLPNGQRESFDTFFLAMAHWQLDEKDKARQWYDRAVQWMEKNKDQLQGNKQRQEELRRFRAEAAALLGIESLPAQPETEMPPAEAPSR
jgi:serine/threonine protein kinase/tetratricopeptide (TPR) repeat protein